MHIVMIASEVTPFAKTGGLADVLGALPRALARLGHAVDVVTPRYRSISEGSRAGEISVALGGRTVVAPIWIVADGNVRTVFVEQKGYFDRDFLYGPPTGDYPDSGERFGFLAMAALEWAGTIPEAVDVVHGHDWQAGLGPLLLRDGRVPARLKKTPAVFTVHNLAYQGVFDASWLPRLGLDARLAGNEALEYWGRTSLLKAGLMCGRCITTVSPRYAEEIQTPEFGFGLDGVLRHRSADLIGVLNGIDYDRWDPASDPLLPDHYDVTDLRGKRAVKRVLLESLGLPADASALDRPLVGMVSRLVDQKGFDLISQAFEDLRALDVAIVLLGAGEPGYEEAWRDRSRQWPDRIGVRIGFDEELAHRIEGGSDIFLMPSRFEPCGLNQMYSLRYGTVPVVRGVGGLLDTVEDFDPVRGAGDGFVFSEYSGEALLTALRRALEVYRNKAVWRGIQQRGMRRDFSWDASAREYVKVYERALV